MIKKLPTHKKDLKDQMGTIGSLIGGFMSIAIGMACLSYVTKSLIDSGITNTPIKEEGQSVMPDRFRSSQ